MSKASGSSGSRYTHSTGSFPSPRAPNIAITIAVKMIDAAEAYRIGLVNRLSEPDALIGTARGLLAAIQANAPVAVACAIESVSRGLEMSIEDGSGIESNLFGLLAATEDMREGMDAFLAKRKAEFRGR